MCYDTLFSLIIFFLRFYIFIHERHRGAGQRPRQRAKQAPCREPDVGLDPRIPGSCPELKAGTKPLSHPGIPPKRTLFEEIVLLCDSAWGLGRQASACVRNAIAWQRLASPGSSSCGRG